MLWLWQLEREPRELYFNDSEVDNYYHNIMSYVPSGNVWLKFHFDIVIKVLSGWISLRVATSFWSCVNS